MSHFQWKYRTIPGPTAAHLFTPGASRSVCDKVTAEGMWMDEALNKTAPRCLLCTRRLAESESWVKKLIGEGATQKA